MAQKDEQALSSCGNTADRNTNNNSAVADPCPICLDPLPPQSWRGTERTRLLCCGKLVCKSCITVLQDHQSELAGGLTTSLSVAYERLQALEGTLKCPMCRADLPRNDLDRYQLVQQNAQERGWAWAKYKLGMYLKDGVGVSVNLPQAVTWFRKAAEQGYLEAKHEYALCLYHGKGIAVNKAEACRWYEKAADSGFALSQYQLGNILLRPEAGGGVPLDPVKGARWLQLASEQGEPISQCDLAYCYEHGDGVPQSPEQALHWCKKSAEQGNVTAMHNYAGNLLVLAARNNDGNVDRVGRSTVPEALYWARRAATGDSDAKRLVAQMEAASKLCANCRYQPVAGDTRLKHCTRCKAIQYCGSECQKKHWKAGHKKDCFDVAKADKDRAGS